MRSPERDRLAAAPTASASGQRPKRRSRANPLRRRSPPLPAAHSAVDELAVDGDRGVDDRCRRRSVWPFSAISTATNQNAMNRPMTSRRKQMENANAIATDSAIAMPNGLRIPIPILIDSAKTGTESEWPTASRSAIDIDSGGGPETATSTECFEIETETATEIETETVTESETASVFVVALCGSSSVDAVGPRHDDEAATSRETANRFVGCSETNCFRHCTETTRRRLLRLH